MVRETTIEIHADLLRRLHRIHRQRTDLRGQIERGPRQIKAGEALVSKAQADVNAAKEQQKRAKVSVDEKQLNLKSRELRVADLKARLNAAASNKEFSLLKDQIAADVQANSVLADEILEGLERLDTLGESLKEVQQALTAQQSEQAERVREIEAKMSGLVSELNRVEQELAEAEKQIPAAALADYHRIVDAKGEDGLAPIDGDSCGGCYQTLTTNMRDRLQLSQLVRCPSCNAFLYLPENRRP